MALVEGTLTLALLAQRFTFYEVSPCVVSRALSLSVVPAMQFTLVPQDLTWCVYNRWPVSNRNSS
jgi:hypothetical protein